MSSNTPRQTCQPLYAHSSRILAAVIAAVTMLGLAAGCSAPWQSSEPQATAPGGTMASSLTALFDQYLEGDDLSAFEREVLERAKQNGKISAEDFQSAHDKEYSCLAEKGYEVEMSKLPNGLYKSGWVKFHGAKVLDDAGLTAYFEANDECDKDVSWVEYLYEIQQGNPGLLSDQYEAAAACLQDSGLVDAAYTGKKLEDTLDNIGASNASSLPFDINSDAAQACLLPAGLAIANE